MSNWYREIRGERYDDAQENARLVTFIGKRVQEISREEISWEIYKDFPEFRKYLFVDWEKRKEELLNNTSQTYWNAVFSDLDINWEDKKDEIFDIVKRHRTLEGLSSFKLNWEDKKEEIFNIAQKNNSLEKLSDLGIDWNDKKNEIFEIVKKRKHLNNLIGLGIDWNDRKEEIFEIAKERGEVVSLSGLGIDWNDKKEEIFEIAKERGEVVSLSGLGIDWNDKKEEIFEIAKKGGDILSLSGLGINWEDKKDEIFEIVKERRSTRGISELEIDWDDEQKKEFERIEEKFIKNKTKLTKEKWIELIKSSSMDKGYVLMFLKSFEKKLSKNELFSVLENIVESTNEWLNKKFQTIKQKNNPVYNSDIDTSLYYNIGPWLSDDLDKIKSSDIEAEKNFLIQILERLEGIGNISQGTKFENEKNNSMGLFFQDNDIENLKKKVSSFSNIELASYLVFYLNKLTKVNEITMYYNALGNFEYNEEYEQILQNPNKEKTNELIKYEESREQAEEKGNKLVANLKYLRNQYNNLIEASNEIQSLKTSSSIINMKTFSEFLERWKENRDESGYFPEDTSNEETKRFYKTFNKKIDEFQQEGYFLQDIENVFVYSSNALDLEDKLYVLKKTLLQQLIEYAKQPENKDKIALQYYKKSTQDTIKTVDELYVYLSESQLPMCFHTNLEDLNGADSFSKVGNEVRYYFNRNSANFISPLTSKDKKIFEIWIKKNEKLDEIIENKVFRDVLKPRNIKNGETYKKNKEEIYNFMEDVTRYFSEESQNSEFLELFRNYKINSDKKSDDNTKTSISNLLDKINMYLNGITGNSKIEKKEKALLEIMTFLIKRSDVRLKSNEMSTDIDKYKSCLESLQMIANQSGVDLIESTEEIESRKTLMTFGKPFSSMKKTLGITDYKETKSSPTVSSNITLSLNTINKMIKGCITSGMKPEDIKKMFTEGEINSELEQYIQEEYDKFAKSPEALRKQTSSSTLTDVSSAGKRILSKRFNKLKDKWEK